MHEFLIIWIIIFIKIKCKESNYDNDSTKFISQDGSLPGRDAQAHIIRI